MSDRTPLLEVTDLTAGYGDLRILQEVNLSVGHGERVLVFGPNGSGKSTLLKALTGIVHPHEGSVRLSGQEIAGREAHLVIRAGISYVPQNDNVFPDLTVEENLEVGAALARRQFSKRRDGVLELFPRLGERRRQLAGSLSGGERQLVAMGRALMLEPSLLLLDEPSAGLSPAMAAQTFDHVLTVNRERGIAVLLVEQNVRQGMDVTERGYLLEAGRVSLTAPVPELRSSRAVSAAYLGGAAQSSGGPSA